VKNHISLWDMTTTHDLIAEIEAAAAALGIAPSTLGERAGQGGHFYARLKAGKRVWPDTAQRVRDAIERMKSSTGGAS